MSCSIRAADGGLLQIQLELKKGVFNPSRRKCCLKKMYEIDLAPKRFALIRRVFGGMFQLTEEFFS